MRQMEGRDVREVLLPCSSAAAMVYLQAASLHVVAYVSSLSNGSRYTGGCVVESRR
jgi:hypothetical protein